MNMQVRTTITQKGQMTLPKSARDQLGVKPGDPVTVVITDDGVMVQRTDTLDDIHHLTRTTTVWPGDEAANKVVQESIVSDHR